MALRIKDLGRLTAVSNGAVLDLNAAGTPFMVGSPMALDVSAEAFVGTAIVAQADNAAMTLNKTTLATLSIGRVDAEVIPTKQFVRLECSAFTSGAIGAALKASS